MKLMQIIKFKKYNTERMLKRKEWRKQDLVEEDLKIGELNWKMIQYNFRKMRIFKQKVDIGSLPITNIGEI